MKTTAAWNTSCFANTTISTPGGVGERRRKSMDRFYLLIVYGACEIEKIGPFYSADARDRRALEIHEQLDCLNALFWLNTRPGRIRTGSYPAMYYEQEVHGEARAN